MSNRLKTTLVVIFFCLQAVISGCATTAGGEVIARELSAQATLVAEQGKRFAAARDELAKSRLGNIQLLENSTIVVQSENELDRTAWRVVGAEFRATLYDAVLEATAHTAELRQEAAQRNREQKAARSQARSAVNFRERELLQAARGLMLLVKPETAEEQRANQRRFVQQVLEGIDGDLKDGLTKSDAGRFIATALEQDITATTADRIREFVNREAEEPSHPAKHDSPTKHTDASGGEQ